MAVIGKVESLWRYPIKSMRGEELSEAFVGFAGIYGDRLYSWSENRHWFEGGNLDPRTRPALRHDHNRSRHNGVQPRNSRQGYQGS